MNLAGRHLDAENEPSFERRSIEPQPSDVVTTLALTRAER